MQLLSIQEATCRPSASPAETLLAAAFEKLWRAHCYAVDVGANAWDFAVEIDEFRRAQISNSELRWLLIRGYARHAAEAPSSDCGRKFRQTASTTLCETSCFVIAEAGLALVESWNMTATKLDPSSIFSGRSSDESIAPSPILPAEARPFWDDKRRQLLVEGKVVKQYHRPAASQQLILHAFQAAHWPVHVADPLPLQPAQCPKRRLHDAVKRLNRGHIHEAIRFSGDGSGRGVLWERLG